MPRTLISLCLLFNTTALAGSVVDLGTVDSEALWQSKETPKEFGDLSKLTVARLSRSDTAYTSVDLAKFRALDDDFRASVNKAWLAGALASKPITKDEYRIYADRIVLHSVTQIDVKDPVALAKILPDYGALYSTAAYKAKPGSKLSLSKDAKAAVDAWMLDPKGIFADDPKVKAAIKAKSRDDVYRLAMDGVGVLQRRYATTIRRDNSDTDGVFGDLGAEVERIEELVGTLPETDDASDDVVYSGVLAGRRYDVYGAEREFMPEYEDCWDLGLAYFRISVGVAARAGLRFPTRTQFSMQNHVTGGAHDEVVPIATSLSTRGRDFTGAEYVSMGLSAMDGKEFAVQGRVWLGARATFLGYPLLHIKTPPEADRFHGGDLTWTLVDATADFTTPMAGDSVSESVVLDHTDSGFGVSYGILDAGVDVKATVTVSPVEQTFHVAHHHLDWDVGFGTVAEPELDMDLSPRDETWRSAMGHGYGHDRVVDYKNATTFGVVVDDARYTVDSTLIGALRLSGAVRTSEIFGVCRDLVLATGWTSMIEIDLDEHTFSSVNQSSTGSATAGVRVFEAE